MRLPVLREQRGNPADTGRVRLGANRMKPRDPIRAVSRLYGAVRIEARPPGRPGDLRVGGDVLTLAEERLVERMLERPQPVLLPGPQAGRQRERRAGLVAGEMNLDSAREGPPVDVARPVDPQVVAAGLEEGPGGGPQLVRQPLDGDLAPVLRRLDRVGFEVRVRTDDVVVEANGAQDASL